MKAVPLPSNMRFDDCDGCRATFNRRVSPVLMTIESTDSSLTIGICPPCALTLCGDDTEKARELSDRVEATARLRPNRMEAPR